MSSITPKNEPVPEIDYDLGDEPESDPAPPEHSDDVTPVEAYEGVPDAYQ